MKSIQTVIILLMLVFMYSDLSFAQGCSDAGFCSINSIKGIEMEHEEIYLNKFSAGISYGKADHNISVANPFIEYMRYINNDLSLTAKLNYFSLTGSLANTSGFSDIILSSSYNWIDNSNLTLGLKIPLNNGDKESSGLPLPMDYQTSLGTYDLIFGVNYILQNSVITFAYQQPLNRNKNKFLPGLYPPGSEAHNYEPAKNYQRKGDVLLRVSHNIDLSKSFRIIPSLLPIYHLGNDTYTDLNGNEMEITGSQGLTLNGNLFIEYSINRRNIIEISYGMPFINRDTRPDGLTRKFVAALAYKIKF